MVTQTDMIYCNVNEILNKDRKVDIQINNIDLKTANSNYALNMLKHYKLINDDYVIIKKHSKVSIKLDGNIKHYIFKYKNIVANLYFDNKKEIY